MSAKLSNSSVNVSKTRANVSNTSSKLSTLVTHSSKIEHGMHAMLHFVVLIDTIIAIVASFNTSLHQIDTIHCTH